MKKTRACPHTVCCSGVEPLRHECRRCAFHDEQEALGRGSVQYLSAGSGIVHSEMNEQDETMRFLQVWLTPDKHGVKPQVGFSELHPAFQNPQDVTWRSNEPEGHPLDSW